MAQLPETAATGEIRRPCAARALTPTSSESSRDSAANLFSRESVLLELSLGTAPDGCVQPETHATTHATGIAQTKGIRMMSPLRGRITATPPRDWSNPTSLSDGLGRPCW